MRVLNALGGAGLICLSLSACTYYRPDPTERIMMVDSPADIRNCRRLGLVSEFAATSPGFETKLDEMIRATVVLGGTDLFLARMSDDWSYIRGIAYRCPGRDGASVRVVRVRG